MPTFLSLPPVIRQIIYNHTLIVGDVWPYGYPNFLTIKRPNTNLLKTSRLINNEASPTLYSKNHFMLPPTLLTVKFLHNTLHSAERRSCMEHISLSLTHEDLPASKHQTMLSKFQLTQPGLQDSALDDHVQKAVKRHLRLVLWPQKVQFILDHLALDSLVLFVWYRGYREAIFAFADGFKNGVTASFRIHGLYPASRRGAEGMVRRWTEQRGEGKMTLRRGREENGMYAVGYEKVEEKEEFGT